MDDRFSWYMYTLNRPEIRSHLSLVKIDKFHRVASVYLAVKNTIASRSEDSACSLNLLSISLAINVCACMQLCSLDTSSLRDTRECVCARVCIFYQLKQRSHEAISDERRGSPFICQCARQPCYNADKKFPQNIVCDILEKKSIRRWELAESSRTR